MPRFTYRSQAVHYLENGEGELLIVLPGNTSAAAAHRQDLERLGRHYRAVALDYLGTGRSDRLGEWPGDWWAEGARQAIALMDHLGEDSARLVGSGGGAIVALHAAATYPARVRAVVADSFSTEFDDAMLEHNIMDQRWDPTPEQKAFWRLCHGTDWRGVVRSDSRVMKELVWDRGGRWLDVDLGAIACPVLLTGSRCDPMVPSIEDDYRALTCQIPDVTVVLCDRGTHPFMWSRADRFLAETLAFLDETVYETVA